MKYLFLAFLVVAFAFANSDGCFDTNISSNPQGSSSNAIALFIVDDWTLAEKALGLDVYICPSGTYILGADNNLEIVQA